jgi:hypothetical protein
MLGGGKGATAWGATDASAPRGGGGIGYGAPHGGKGATTAKLCAGEQWRSLIESGVYGSPSEITRAVVGPGGARVRDLQRSSGASVIIDRANASITMSGSLKAVVLARAAIDTIVVPAATIDVAAHWGGLISDGVHASKEDLMKVLHGRDGERKNAIERASGAFIWQSNDSTRVFLSGNAAEIARARTALDAVVIPAATIDVAAHWGGLMTAVGLSADECLRLIYGARASRLVSLQRATGCAIWASKDGSRVFLSGDAAAVARGRDAIGEIFAHLTAQLQILDAFACGSGSEEVLRITGVTSGERALLHARAFQLGGLKTSSHGEGGAREFTAIRVAAPDAALSDPDDGADPKQ